MQPSQTGRWASLHMWLTTFCMQVVRVHPKPWLAISCLGMISSILSRGNKCYQYRIVLYYTVPYHTVPGTPARPSRTSEPHLWILLHHYLYYNYSGVVVLLYHHHHNSVSALCYHYHHITHSSASCRCRYLRLQYTHPPLSSVLLTPYTIAHRSS